MLTLYQFPISHYCEKVRWALEYKGLAYTKIDLLPGFHVKTVKKIAAKQEVPVLVHDGRVVQNSSDIITYLDKTFPDRPLTPGSAELEEQALRWEAYVDENIGPQIRVYCYHYFLDRTDIVLPMLTHGQAWHRKMMFRLAFPKVREAMRKFMRINERTAGISLEKVTGAVDKLHAQLEQSRFLAGDKFSRADLAAAALLAPFIRPEKYGITWPEAFPEEMASAVNALGPGLDWVEAVYRDYR
ncbi:glutathione S-transferase [Thiogranum longum]|uniref:Glutathione S-transferase n=1 Tax=Thiogranum longum TaxID=1537524 RepID=A0A4R1H9Z1_9GAMM|nr:glutathione S-transferase [Thiogranum longum]TCK18734.1 glutathione S-transferase [Thiogranum longum]